MSFVVLRSNLRDALLITERALGDNVNLPVLKSLLFNVNRDGIFISSTNLEMGITTQCSAKIISEGSFVVNSGTLSSVIGNITSERLDIKINEKTLEIKSDNYEANILISSEEFPIIPDVENKSNYIEIDGGFLGEALAQIVPAVKFSEIRPEISGVLFNLNATLLTIIGTDSFRLAEKKISDTNFTSNYESGFGCIIPIKTAEECIKIFKKNESIRLYFDEHQLLIKNKQTDLISRVIEGNFPDYKAIIPNNFETDVEADKNDIINALKFVVSANQNINEVKISIKKGKKFFEILSTERSLGRFKTTIPAKIDGNDSEVVFNWRFLLDGLRSTSDVKVRLSLNGDSRPALISSDDHSYIYVIMPVKQ